MDKPDKNSDVDERNSILDSFLPQLKSFVKSETVFGEPYTVGSVTIIPVNSVKVGFGFGKGDIRKKMDSTGGGGGVLLTPMAFLVVKGDDVTIHSLSAGTIENVIDKVPDALDKFLSVIKGIRDKKKAPEQ